MTCRQQRNNIEPIGVGDLIIKSTDDTGQVIMDFEHRRILSDYKDLPMSWRTRIKIRIQKLVARRTKRK